MHCVSYLEDVCRKGMGFESRDSIEAASELISHRVAFAPYACDASSLVI